MKRIKEETVYDIDRRGDMEVFKFGGINEAKVPLYHGRKIHKQDEEHEAIPLKRIHLEPFEKLPMRIESEGFELLGEFVAIPEEGEMVPVEYDTSLARQKELNVALGKDPKRIDLWIQLLDLQDDLIQMRLRSAILERKLAIIERATNECGREGEYWRLLVYEMKCRGELESYETVKDRWTKLLSENHCGDSLLSLWNAYLDWLQSDCGLSKFSVSDCLHAYSQAFQSMNYEIDFKFFARYCHFLKDIDYMERLSVLLVMVVRNGFGQPDLEKMIKRLRPGRTEFSYACDPSESSVMNWTRLETLSRAVFWFPRSSNLTDDPSEPVEDFMREIVIDELEPIKLMSGKFDDLIRLASELIEVKGVVSSDHQFHFSNDLDVAPESFSILRGDLGYSTDRLSFITELHRMEPTYYRAFEILKAINPFCQNMPHNREYLDFIQNSQVDEDLGATTELQTLISWYQTTDQFYPRAGIGPLVIGLYLLAWEVNNRKASDEYKDMVYSWLKKDLGNPALIELAWRMDGRMRFRCNFRQWLDDLKEEEAEKVWPVVIGLEEGSCDPIKFASLCEKALKLVRSDRKSVWLPYLRNGPRDPHAYKSLVYRAIADCPYCKDIYLTAIQEGVRREALQEHEAEELVNLMEEKGIRLRHLIEEATL